MRFSTIIAAIVLAAAMAFPALAGCRRCRPLVVTPAPVQRMEVLMAPVVTRRVWVLEKRFFRGYKLIPKDIPFVVIPK